MNANINESNFKRWKLQTERKNDKSIKGSIDKLIVNLIKLINSREEYCTTSSCSGRICVISDEVLPNNTSINPQKRKKCHFYLVTHDPLILSSVQNVLKDVSCSAKLKFEGFVMHVRCQTLDGAQKVLASAIAAGFRNSGISLGKKCQNIIVGVRGTLCLEVPLTNNKGELMVGVDYLSYVVDLANKKLDENLCRINNFEKKLKSVFFASPSLELKSAKGPFVTSTNSPTVVKRIIPDDLEDDLYKLFDDED